VELNKKFKGGILMNQTQTMAGANTAKDILNDMLMTEKYVSGTYETAILESANEAVRNALRQIQDEEQQHAKMIFDAMNQRGWYNPQ